MLDKLFTTARTHSVWLDKPVDDALLQQAYDLAKMGPTSMNCQPLRIVFIKSKLTRLNVVKLFLDDKGARKK